MAEHRVVITADRPGLSEVRTANDPDRGRPPVWSQDPLQLQHLAAEHSAAEHWAAEHWAAELATIDGVDRARRQEHGSAA